MRTCRSRFFMLITAALVLAPEAPARADLVGTGTVRAVTPGNVQSGIDAANEPGTDRVTIAVRGTDNQIWVNSGDFDPWFRLPLLPGGVKGDPAITSWTAGRLDVFVRGADDKLWQSTRFSVLGAFQPWIKPVGDDGILAGSPDATALRPGRLDVFVKGADGQIYQRFWNDVSWNSAWIAHGAPTPTISVTGDPTVVWGRPTVVNRMDLFVRGSDDKLWQNNWNGAAWSGWARPVGLAGTLASSPDATLFDRGGTPQSQSNIAVFARGTDGGLWVLDFTSAGWGNWRRFGTALDTIVDAPGAAYRPDRRIDVFGRGGDNFAYHFAFQHAATFP